MNITTKYDLGQYVYPISLGGYDSVIKCETCKSKGYVCINDSTRTVRCPDCGGKGGRREWKPTKWFVSLELSGFIGKVEASLYDNSHGKGREIKYMLSSTGIGSGTLWREDMLYNSVAEAHAECERRNALTFKNCTKL